MIVKANSRFIGYVGISAILVSTNNKQAYNKLQYAISSGLARASRVDDEVAGVGQSRGPNFA
jgi:hypothetical protein